MIEKPWMGAEEQEGGMDEEKSPMAEICEEMKVYTDSGKAVPVQKVQEWMGKLEDIGGYMDQGESDEGDQPKSGGIAILIKNKGAKMASLIAGLFLFGMVAAAKAENLLTFSSNTASASTGTVVNVSTSSRADRLDFINVNTPGTNSKIDVWDWKGSTLTAARKLGSFDTTAKFNWTFGPYGLDISTDVLIYNQGNPPADVTIGGRRTSRTFP